MRYFAGFDNHGVNYVWLFAPKDVARYHTRRAIQLIDENRWLLDVRNDNPQGNQPGNGDERK